MKDITIDSEILGGIPVFTETRVPVQTLFDYLVRIPMKADTCSD